MATDAKSLLSQANCFACYGNSPYTLKLMQLSLWAQLGGGGGGGGSPVTGTWFDSFPAASISGGSQINTPNFSYSMPITIGKNGTVTTLRVGFQALSAGPSGDGIKLALYTAGGSLLGSVTGVALPADANSIKPFTLSAGIPVTVGNYLVAMSINSSGGDTISSNASASTALVYTTLPYSSFPAATLPASSAYGANLFLGAQVV